MVEAFMNGILKNGSAPIAIDEIYAVTTASFKVLESIKNGGQQVDIIS